MASNLSEVQKRQGPWRKAKVLSDLELGSPSARNSWYDLSALTSVYLGSLLCTVGTVRPSLPISLNHCEDGPSSRQAEVAQPANKNQLILPIFQGVVQADHLPGTLPGPPGLVH